MKEFSKKIGAVLMTFIVVFSTMSFSVSHHYCGSEIVDVALFSKAKTCGVNMNMEMPSSSDDCKFGDKDCCTISETEFEPTVINLTFEQQLFVASFIYTYINLFEGLENNIIPFKNYSPPILVTDIHIVDQVFLI